MDQQRVVSALALLSKINKAGYKAVICGGYVRDTICDKPIRDIDISVSADDYEDVYLFLSGTHSFAEPVNTGDRYVHASITLQEEFDIRSDLRGDLPTERINLIGLRDHYDGALTAQAVMSKINIGICMAGIELAAGRIIIGDEFRRDYKDKQITLYRTDWGYEGTLKHFIKLQAKYPWPLRVHKQEELI
jgi:hypothetical protein